MHLQKAVMPETSFCNRSAIPDFKVLQFKISNHIISVFEMSFKIKRLKTNEQNQNN